MNELKEKEEKISDAFGQEEGDIISHVFIMHKNESYDQSIESKIIHKKKN